MTVETATERTVNSPSQPVVEGLLAAVRNATHALEGEAAAAMALEQAYREANAAAAEVKRTVKCEAAARDQVAQCQRSEKQPLRDADKAKDAAARADQNAADKQARWQAEEARLTAAEKRGKRTDRQWADKAKVKADEAERRAKSARAAAERAAHDSEAACQETRTAQDRAREAALSLRSARIADVKAKREVEKAGENARNSIEKARTALQTEASAKRSLDHAIGTLKAAMLKEARTAEAEAAGKALVPRETSVTSTGAPNKAGRVIRKLRAPAMVLIKRGAAARSPQTPRPHVSQEPAVPKEVRRRRGGEPKADLYRGEVRLLVPGPVDHQDVSLLRHGLESLAGLRIMSMGGYSGEGASITVVADRPLPLASEISQLHVVEKTSRMGGDIEVRLRLPAGRPSS